MVDAEIVRVLFVCLGNICRSPTAEGVFRAHVSRAGLGQRIGIDSAGTSSYHIGEAPDPRAVQAAGLRDYDLAALRARQVSDDDFTYYDYILAMDLNNLRDLNNRCPAQEETRLGLFLSYADNGPQEVPDPYYGGPEGFQAVLDMIEAASAGLLNDINARYPALAQ